MVKDFIDMLAIGVTALDPVKNETDTKQKAIWIVVLLAVVIICVVLSRLKIDFAGKIQAKKDETVRKQKEKMRDEELDRLHEIKRKNKRK